MFRIFKVIEDGCTWIEVEGEVDRAAFGEIQSLFSRQPAGRPIGLRFRNGVRVTPEAANALRQLGVVAVTADSPFLRLLLERSGVDGKE